MLDNSFLVHFTFMFHKNSMFFLGPNKIFSMLFISQKSKQTKMMQKFQFHKLKDLRYLSSLVHSLNVENGSRKTVPSRKKMRGFEIK